MPGMGASSGAFGPWCRALWKNYIQSLKTGFLNNGWGKQTKNTIRKNKMSLLPAKSAMPG